MFESAGREQVTMRGRGTLCSSNIVLRGMLDHNTPAPWGESSVKKFERDVWLRKWYESIRDHTSVTLVSLWAAG